MSMLMASCPRCRTEVNTGVSADEQMVEQLGPKLHVLILCDTCRAYQKMMVKDLYLATEEVAA